MSSPGSNPNDLTRQQLDELDALLQRMLSVAPPTGSAKPSAPPVPAAESPLIREFSGATSTSPGLPSGWRADPNAPAKPPHLRESLPSGVATAMPEMQAASMPTMAEPGSSAQTDSGHFPHFGLPAGLTSPPASSPFSASPLTPVQASESTPARGPLRGVDLPDLPKIHQPEVEPEPKPFIEEEELAELVPAQPDPDRLPIALWPLFAVNWLIELVLRLMGPFGRWLTTPIMKHLLGWTGILLICGSALWAANSLGWVKLDLQKWIARF